MIVNYLCPGNPLSKASVDLEVLLARHNSQCTAQKNELLFVITKMQSVKLSSRSNYDRSSLSRRIIVISKRAADRIGTLNFFLLISVP